MLDVTLRLCLPLLVALAFAPLRAQEDQPVHMRPELPLCFPLAMKGDDVTVQYPVMINQTTVLKPGMQLRVLYMINRDLQDGDLAIAHAGTLQNSYARNAFADGPDGAKMSPEMAHEIEGYRRTVWDVPNNFVLAMAQYPTELMHLIYSPTDSARDLHDEMFSFFDGLFVGSPSGKVTVIAVVKDSVASHAGMKAGDEIVAVGAYATHDDLLTFANAYSSAKKDARENETASYSVTLRNPDGTTRLANLAMPIRIRGGLMDGFH
jgi:hypothetical protein